MKNVKCAKCVSCSEEYEPLPDITLCPSCGGVLDIVFDYDYIKTVSGKDYFSNCTENSIWRYKSFLPVCEDTPAPILSVGISPLYDASRLASQIGIKKLYIKDDGQNPTSSLKDRASSIAVAKAIEAGASVIACASTGNAATSLAGNAAAAGLSTYIFVPSRAPFAKLSQLLIFGATVISVEGTYSDAFELSSKAIEKYGWYNRNAAINPYLLEGKKTVSFEIAQQLGWKVPDYLAVSVGDGCTIAGVWKGFCDLFKAGLIDCLPRLISVQARGCYPINLAARSGRPLNPMEENTIADSIAVGVPRNPVKAINAIIESKGIALEVSDDEILKAMRVLGNSCGVFGEPAGAAGAAGLIKALESGLIPKDISAAVIVTGNGLKDTAGAIKAAGEPIRIPPDMSALEKALF